MIWGTGPARGVPWWRHRRPLTLRHVYGWTGYSWGSTGRPEPEGKPREGHQVVRIGDQQ